MTSKRPLSRSLSYPLTIDGPNATAARPEVKQLVFDFLAARRREGVDMTAIEHLLITNGYNPLAAQKIISEFRRAGAIEDTVVRRPRETIRLIV